MYTLTLTLLPRSPAPPLSPTHLETNYTCQVRLHVLVVQDGEAQVVVQEELDLSLALEERVSRSKGRGRSAAARAGEEQGRKWKWSGV